MELVWNVGEYSRVCGCVGGLIHHYAHRLFKENLQVSYIANLISVDLFLYFLE
jgi:hypothetical protein